MNDRSPMRQDVTPGDEDKVQSPEGHSIAIFSSFMNAVIGPMERLSKIAEMGAPPYVLGSGVVVIVVALGIHFVEYIVPSPGRGSPLDATEFVALLVIGVILLLTGSGMRIYEYKRSMDATETTQKAGVEILKQTEETARQMIGKQLPPIR